MSDFRDFQSVFDLSSDAETDFDCTIGMEEDDMLIEAVEGFNEGTIPDVNMKDFEDLHDTDDVKATVKDFESELGPGHDSKGANAPTIDSTKTQEIIGDDVMDVLDLACPTFGVADAVQKGEGPDPEHINKEIDSKSDPMENSYERHENSSSPKAEATEYDIALEELLAEGEDVDADSSEEDTGAAGCKGAGGCGVKKEEVDNIDDVDDVDSLEDEEDYSGYSDDEEGDLEESTDLDDAVGVDSLEVPEDGAIEEEREDDVHKDFGEPSVDPTHTKEVEGDEGPVIDATKEAYSIFDLLEGDGCVNKNPVSDEMDDCVHGDFGKPSVEPTHDKEVEGDEGPVIDEEASVDSLEEGDVVGDIGLRDIDMGMDDLEMGDDPDDNDQEQLQDEEDIDDVGLDEAFAQIMREADELLKDDEDKEGAGGCKKESTSVDSFDEESVDSLEDTPTEEVIDDITISAADDADGIMSDDEVNSLANVEDDDILDDILGQ